ncbi:MAG: bacillithiol biosynthesis cysteine-adding enzyme BshC [Crocinitomicaceae bacterium]|nr:bacillithiol biosynthesis cysteine-adding enzyme BshC [Crocinitomicaceae bacterium]
MVYKQDVYTPYINHEFSIRNFERQQLEKRKNYSAVTRSVLVKSLEKSYSIIEDKGLTSKNIELLKRDNTLTVTTGHQLSLFTGPLFFVIKIIHVIKLAERLNQEDQEMNVVPVFWMATEDHDFEEIQSVNLFGKQVTWESDQKGPVGRFDLEGFDAVKKEIIDFFGNHAEAQIHRLMNVYDGANLAEATFKLVHELFKGYGLVIIDGDKTELKSLFVPTMKKELEEQFAFEAVSKTNKALEKDGGKIQVFAREINLFYIEKGIRQRIEKIDKGYKVDGVGEFSKEEMLAKLNEHPEAFSPNVILRPLYQETILPNLAYVGGGGEISYWLQLKRVFDAVDVVYPLIGVRNSVMWIEENISKKIAKIDLQLEDLFKKTDLIKREFIEQNESEDLNFESMEAMSIELGKQIEDAILLVEPNMSGYAKAEIAKLEKQLTGVKSKLIKLSKSKHERSMKIIEQVREKLFPNDGLQERTTNIISFSPEGNISERIDTLYRAIDPEEKDFIVLREF